MRRLKTMGLVAILAAAATASFAQSHSVHCDNASKGVRGGAFESSTSSTTSVSGVLLESEAAEGSFVVEPESLNGRNYRFRFTEDVKLKADKRTRLHGLKELTLGDYQTGDRVQVRFRPSDGRVYELKLKR